MHLLENGTDVRYVQSLLGHVKLETTTIYTKIALRRNEQEARSPLDVLTGKQLAPQAANPPVGRLRIELTPRAGEPAADVNLVILGGEHPVDLDGIVVREIRPGWTPFDGNRRTELAFRPSEVA